MKPEFGHSVERKQFGCCDEHFEFESGPKFKLKSFKNYADHFKRQYFVKEDQITASNFNSDATQMLSEPSIPDIEGEYWRIIENPTEEIEVSSGIAIFFSRDLPNFFFLSIIFSYLSFSIWFIRCSMGILRKLVQAKVVFHLKPIHGM